ncbi:mitochondrial matrix protein, f1f0 ATP synthase assembly factor fmc1 [Gigaspora margarita]|nr:mitochondrial matrix protein, f1f0 ATP synthase assembly factor fmc1 [Gigaspora margarita]
MTNTLLSTYRQLLKEINKQFTSQNNNQYWKQQLIEAFRKNKDITNIEVSQRLNQDAQDVLSFLRSNRRHNELLASYNPTHGQSEEKRVELTANRVGLKVPGSDV